MANACLLETNSKDACECLKLVQISFVFYTDDFWMNMSHSHINGKSVWDCFHTETSRFPTSPRRTSPLPGTQCGEEPFVNLTVLSVHDLTKMGLSFLWSIIVTYITYTQIITFIDAIFKCIHYTVFITHSGPNSIRVLLTQQHNKPVWEKYNKYLGEDLRKKSIDQYQTAVYIYMVERNRTSQEKQ